MNATSIIERVRAAGGEIALASDGIKLKIPVLLRDDVVAEVKAHRNAIKVALKRETDDPWDAADYRAFYEERAGVAEFDGGLVREDAEAAAFEACVVEWLTRHPEPSPPGYCASCHRSASDSAVVVPFGAGKLHTWLHPECWPVWYRACVDRAVKELAALGLQKPSGGRRRIGDNP